MAGKGREDRERITCGDPWPTVRPTFEPWILHWSSAYLFSAVIWSCASFIAF